jgi:ABC-type transport system involved in multi-copper enzyme maturation permease subunit
MVYVWCTGGILLAALVTQTYLEAIGALGIGVYEDPLQYPFLLAVEACGLYFSLWASTRISRERESGTLEVLFWTPVDDLGLILGKILGSVTASAVFIFLVLGFLAVAGRLTGLVFPENVAELLLSSIIFVGSMVAVGTFVSTLAGRVRTAVAVLMALVALFLGLQIVVGFLGNLPPEQLSRSLLLMRDSLILLTRITGVLSPVQYFAWSLDALKLGNPGQYDLSVATALAHFSAFVAISVFMLKARGVRK